MSCTQIILHEYGVAFLLELEYILTNKHTCIHTYTHTHTHTHTFLPSIPWKVNKTTNTEHQITVFIAFLFRFGRPALKGNYIAEIWKKRVGLNSEKILRRGQHFCTPNFPHGKSLSTSKPKAMQTSLSVTDGRNTYQKAIVNTSR